MNKIYKTIRNAFTGKTTVASEHAQSSGAGQQGVAQKTAATLPPAARSAISTLSTFTAFTVLSSITICTSSLAQTLVYDGTAASGTAHLESEGSTGANLPTWLGLASNAKGLIYRDAGSTVPTEAALEINYTPNGTNEPQFAIGGYSATTSVEVKDNTLTLTFGQVNGPVYAALSHVTLITPNVDNSSSFATDSSASTVANVGSPTASANSNHVIMKTGTLVSGDLSGGYATVIATAGNATAGTPDFNPDPYTNATANADASATAYGSTASANSNTVTVEVGGAVDGNITGGSARIDATAGNAAAGTATATGNATANAYADVTADGSIASANNNVVSVGSNTTVGGGITGGAVRIDAAAGGAAAGNTTANSANANAYAYASASADGSAANAGSNRVTVGNGAAVGGGITGGSARIDATAGNATAGNATANSTQASGINARADAYARADANDSTVSANSNAVTVGSNAKVNGGITGGSARIDATAAAATATAATTANAGANASANASARASANGSTVRANSNAVTVGANTTVGGHITGGAAQLTVTGGTAKGGTITKGGNTSYGNADASVDVSNANVFANQNTVDFDGILQNGSNIYGGLVVFDITKGTATKADGNDGGANVNLYGSQAQATGNIVTLGANAKISQSTSSIYGGYLEFNTGFAPENYDVFTGNTLNFSAQPITIKTLANFEHYNFTINPAYASAPLITAQDITLGANPDNVSTGDTTPSQIKVVGIHSGTTLSVGDEFILMQATSNMTGTGVGLSTTNVAQQGISLLYDVQTTVNIAGKQVTATILARNGGGGGGLAATVNPQLKALSEGYLSGLMLVSRGADAVAFNAHNAIRAQNPEQGLAPFALVSAGHTRYNSGSHIKSNDYLLMGGVSYRFNALSAGVFVEGGWGDYDSYNSFYNAANVHGDGHNNYYGAGILGRYDFESGLYTDGSLRFGQSRTKFDTTDIVNFATGQFASYDIKSHYASAHFGVGYIHPLSERNNVDLSVKYLWSGVGGKSALVAGDRIDFQRMNSHRVRLNAQMNRQHSNDLTLSAGLGYEQEFDGKANATTYHIYNIKAPSVKGGTGIVTVGAKIKPTSNHRLTLDLKADGYVGKREGVRATMMLNYAF